jgi:hypothetical protein
VKNEFGGPRPRLRECASGGEDMQERKALGIGVILLTGTDTEEVDL